MKEEKIKVGDEVFARYNKKANWKRARVWQIDFNRTLPYGIEKQCLTHAHGQYGEWFPAFRVKRENIKPINKQP